MPVGPVTRSAVVEVVAALREEILSGQLSGGTPVREHEVADRLHVSRTPVREALSQLVAEGLLVKDAKKTAHVFRPSLSELLEIYEIRIPLESLAARLAAENADVAFELRLVAAHDALVAAKPGLDWSARHEEFHLCLCRGSGRVRLVTLVRTLRAQSEPYVRFAVALDDELRESARRDHQEMVELVQARDSRGLDALVRRHLARTATHVEALLDRGAGGPGSQMQLPSLGEPAP